MIVCLWAGTFIVQLMTQAMGPFIRNRQLNLFKSDLCFCLENVGQKGHQVIDFLKCFSFQPSTTVPQTWPGATTGKTEFPKLAILECLIWRDMQTGTNEMKSPDL